MDVIKFNIPANSALLYGGEIINGLDSKMWVERYREPSEFEFVADVETDMRKKLPVGTLVSHVDTGEVMVVENHEIREEAGEPTKIKITGRSFETFLENRIVGANKSFPTTASATAEFELAANYVWNHILTIIRYHMYSDQVIDPADAIPNVTVMHNVPGVGEFVGRSIKRGDVYTRVQELLDLEGLGIRSARPGYRSPLALTDPKMCILVHRGLDLRADVAFSALTGEIESADYLWSNKKAKNAILVTGRWIETVVKQSGAGLTRRMMFLEASDIDNAYTSAPTGTARDTVITQMQARGRAVLAAQRELALVNTETNKNQTTYKYREHYEVGDIVTVEGSFSETRAMRVAAHVEIEDENGQLSYPTLSAL